MMLYVLIVVAFLDTFVQLPVMSPFASQLGAGPVMIGFIVGMYSLTNMVGNVWAGRWIDRAGPKKVLLTGMAATAAVLLLYMLVRTPVQLASVRFIHGLTGGLLVPSVFTLASSRGKRGRHGRNLAISGAAVGIAAVIGPALGGILKGTLGLNWVFGIMSTLLALGTAAVALFIREQRKDVQMDGTASSSRDSRPDSQWIDLFRNRYAVLSYFGAFSLMFTMGVVTYMLPLKTEGLHLGDEAAGMMLSTFGLVAILLFVAPTNRMYDRYSAASMMLAGMAIIAAAVFGLSAADGRVPLTAVMALYGIGFALMFPSMNKLLVEHVPESSRGMAFGLFYAFYSIGVVAGSFVIGAVASGTTSGFRIAAGFMAVMCVLVWLMKRQAQSERNLMHETREES